MISFVLRFEGQPNSTFPVIQVNGDGIGKALAKTAERRRRSSGIFMRYASSRKYKNIGIISTQEVEDGLSVVLLLSFLAQGGGVRPSL
jgi:hypothetical protein